MAKEDQAAVEAPAEGGSKKKLFIIVGAAVVVLVIAGVVAFLMMGRGDKKKEGADAHGAPAAADAGHGTAPAVDGHGAAGAAGASTVFPLEPFIVNIYDGQDLRYLKVKIELEMVNPMVKGELDSHLAAVRDAILVVLTTKTLQEVQDVQGKNQLREEILTAISKILAQGKVSKVYFTDFVVQ